MIPALKNLYNRLYDHKKAIIILIILIIVFFTSQKIINRNPNVDKNSSQYINSIYMSDGMVYNNYLNTQEKEMYDFILNNVRKNKRVINTTLENHNCQSYQDCFGYISRANKAIMLDHPELLSYGGADWEYKTSKNKLIIRIRKPFRLPLMTQIGEMIINAKLNKIKKETANMTDKEKVKYVYNYIGNNTTYDRIFTDDSKNQTIYNVFVKDNAVCAGFAKASQVIFQAIGIKSYTVLGHTSGYHMWNIIEIDGKYYFYDSTVASSIKNDSSYYYYGLIQNEFKDYKMSNPEWYPSVTKEELFSLNELQ